MTERLTEAVDIVYLDACVRLLHAAQDDNQEKARALKEFADSLEEFYPGVRDRAWERRSPFQSPIDKTGER